MSEPGVSPSTTTVDSSRRLRSKRPVIVGVDGSDEARRGLLFAAGLAEMLDVEMIVVHAYGLVGSFGDWRLGVEERERQVNAVMSAEWCAPLADHPNLTWRSHCVQGSAVEGILRAADEVDAGLVVVGSHGAGRSSAPLLGSTSQDIIQHSRRPVVVVPPADDHPHGRVGVDALPDPVAGD